MTWTSRQDADALKTRAWLSDAAKDLGFDQLGVTTPDAVPQLPERLRQFLAEGRHGEMTWLGDKADWRTDPAALWPEVKSIVLLGMNYGPDMDPLTRLDKTLTGVISVYAGHRDYHDILKGRLKQLGQQLIARAGGGIKVFVDTAPVAEKPLAEAAGLGWQGKHTNLVSRQFGSWLFLGALFTTLPLPVDTKEEDHCGSCQACLDICPTNAFPAPYQLDARRCISYLTIEHHGPIPRDLRAAMGNRIYGCDDCLAVCPWNSFAQRASELSFHFRDDLRAPSLSDLVRLDDAAFRKLFSGSPVKRIGRDRFVRNVLIAMGNSGDKELTTFILPLLSDSTAVVRGAAVWALFKLAPGLAQEKAVTRAHPDSDETVEQEWQAVSPS